MATLIFPLPHLATPHLPTAWHSCVRSCLEDLCTIGALFQMSLALDIAERRGSEIRF